MKAGVVQFVEAQLNQPSEPLFHSDSKVSKDVGYIDDRTACVFLLSTFCMMYIFLSSL